MAEKPESEKTTKASIPITGMTCTNCAATIEKGLAETPGVEHANVNFGSEKASIAYDPNKVSLSKIKDTISELGYGMATKKSIYPVGGMTCASCVAHVEEALKSVPGVVSVGVNLGSEKATVEYLEGTTYADMKKAVEDAGYELGQGIRSPRRCQRNIATGSPQGQKQVYFCGHSHHSDCRNDADPRFQGDGILALGAGHPGAILGRLALL